MQTHYQTGSRQFAELEIDFIEKFINRVNRRAAESEYQSGVFKNGHQRAMFEVLSDYESNLSRLKPKGGQTNESICKCEVSIDETGT